jgi:serine/threonine-protein kinase
VIAYPVPGDQFGRYDVTRRIGRGGMGVVYAAVHRDLERDVALKLLSPDLADSEDYRNRFIREARVLARLDSPHIVRVHDAGEQDGWLFIATELLPDGDLHDLLNSTGPLPAELAIDLVSQVADGLAAAHDAGVLHRDIKPSNVLVRVRPDGSRQAVVCDFGISAVVGADHTKTAGVIGTLGYMAPERHEGQPASVASDVYALGCLLYALVAGQAPYVGTDVKVAMGTSTSRCRRCPMRRPQPRRSTPSSGSRWPRIRPRGTSMRAH